MPYPKGEPGLVLGLGIGVWTQVKGALMVSSVMSGKLHGWVLVMMFSFSCWGALEFLQLLLFCLFLLGGAVCGEGGGERERILRIFHTQCRATWVSISQP